MGWWKTDRDLLLGDGPLDEVEGFLQAFCSHYVEDHGRKPVLAELLSSLLSVLSTRADEFTSDCHERVISALLPKTKRRRKRVTPRIGDVFALPLEDGTFAYARVTPQSSYVQVYGARSRRPLRIGQLLDVHILEVPFMCFLYDVENRQWPIIGNSLAGLEAFSVKHFLVGYSITCNESQGPDGFIDVTAATRVATPEELSTTPRNGFLHGKFLISAISKLVGKLPLVD